MEKSKTAPAWRLALLPIEVIGLGLFLAICVWLAFAAIGFAIGLTLGAASSDAFMSGFGSLPVSLAAFGFGAIRGAWTAKPPGGARAAIITMGALLLAGLVIAARSISPLAASIASLAPFAGGLLFLAIARVGRS